MVNSIQCLQCLLINCLGKSRAWTRKMKNHLLTHSRNSRDQLQLPSWQQASDCSTERIRDFSIGWEGMLSTLIRNVTTYRGMQSNLGGTNRAATSIIRGRRRARWLTCCLLLHKCRTFLEVTVRILGKSARNPIIMEPPSHQQYQTVSHQKWIALLNLANSSFHQLLMIFPSILLSLTSFRYSYFNIQNRLPAK